MKEIKITNACINNLKNINVNIPKNKFVVVTGVSGSGKSSLIFDILYNEGRDRYLQSIGYPRHVVDHENYFDSIKGICPVVAVEQRLIRASNPRSVVGTRTKIYEYLKLLYSVEGKMKCPHCGNEELKNLVCGECGEKVEKLNIRHFSFNSKTGMCRSCSGRGVINEVSIHKIIKNPKDSLKKICTPKPIFYGVHKMLLTFERVFKVDINTPYKDLPEEVKAGFINGFENVEGESFEGVLKYLKDKMDRSKGTGDYIRRELCEARECEECRGMRIGKLARNITIEGINIAEASNLTMIELKEFLTEYEIKNQLSDFSKSTIKGILEQLKNFIDVGLSYLTLYRMVSTLSGGEMQRLFLVSHLGSKMDSLMYIFDEPTAGLHEIEKEMILNKIKDLQKIGNSIIIVEHDKNTIERAQHIIEFGPGAGIEGGRVIYEGDLEKLKVSENSITGQYISEKVKMYKKYKDDYITISDAAAKVSLKNVNTNNLKNISLDIPLGCIVGIAGVSGSGKSSLVINTLVPLLQKYFSHKNNKSDKAKNDEDELNNEEIEMFLAVKPVIEEISGIDNLKGFAEISQEPIGRSRKSIPAAYIGIYDKIRKIFASQPEAVNRAYKAGHFSFNSKGACPECKGVGIVQILIGESKLPFASSPCPECNGKGFNKEILDITYKEKNILDVLEMSVSEALEFFKEHKQIKAALEILDRIGMGYMPLGQPTPTLSGGEAQRIKLAKELIKIPPKSKKGGILYIFDEPTTGLSFHDTAKLFPIFNELIERGNSIIIIEHDPDVLAYCDYIIELGPKGGIYGGEVIAEGTPFEIVNNKDSIIGRYLDKH